jgi:recombination protein RecT
MSETVGQAVERTSGAVSMIESANFAAVLPEHIGAQKFTRWSVSLLRQPDMLEVAKTEAGKLSIVSALLDCASLGLEPGRTYHLVKFGQQVTGIIDYKGEIELINRADRRAYVVAMLVREKDHFAMLGANTPPHHDADWFGDRGEVTGGYAYVGSSGDRCSMVVLMSEADFLKHRNKARTKNVWDEWPEPMRLKTLVHQLRKFVPWSAEWLPS